MKRQWHYCGCGKDGSHPFSGILWADSQEEAHKLALREKPSSLGDDLMLGVMDLMPQLTGGSSNGNWDSQPPDRPSDSPDHGD